MPTADWVNGPLVNGIKPAAGLTETTTVVAHVKGDSRTKNLVQRMKHSVE